MDKITPKAYVTGVKRGEITIALTDKSLVLPVGYALYSYEDVLAERETCAKVCEEAAELTSSNGADFYKAMASMIRSRGGST